MSMGATIIVAMPMGGEKAPASARARSTDLASPWERPRPDHASGQVGKPQPLSASRCHHCPSGRSGSQLASNQERAAA